MQRVVIAGASGFIGRRLVASYREGGDSVTTIGRGGADVTWSDVDGVVRAVDGADLIVNLAGRTVNCRYTPENRAVILDSRVETTRQLSDAVQRSAEPARVWMNSSTATIYRHAEDRPMTESTGELGSGFSVGVARAWEDAFFDGDLPATRRLALRLAIVLGDDGALVPLARLARFGLGGAQLDGRWPSTAARRRAGIYHAFAARGGRQRFSWVHIDDVIDTVRFANETPGLSGVLNVAAPEASDSRELMATLRSTVGVRVGIPAPRWMLEIGSAVIRTETELVLKSRWVAPERLLAAGYRFRHPSLAPALRSILRKS